MRLAEDKFKTLYTTKALCKLKLEFRYQNDFEITLKLFKAAFINIIQANIQSHRAKGLKEIVKMEKKKRNRSKRLNLIGEKGNRAFLYSPGAILEAKIYQYTKTLAIQQGKEAKKLKKAEKKAEKEKKHLEAQERARQKEVDRQILQGFKKHNKKAPKASKSPIKKTKSTPKPSTIVDLTSQEAIKPLDTKKVDISKDNEKGVKTRTRRGRAIIVPIRFKG
ncbi:hypothetical protein BPAE_1345g00010 [Botrytis paeoniae]|uniref:Uncharacterized protein n=1 Tax=Botrytis paeoniae TaxID=278948 RepID=A0A4Z1EEY9_9HELO|nr:hypothetical protein BPAE_1345g00010 [Botrytis paeoniae]